MVTRLAASATGEEPEHLSNLWRIDRRIPLALIVTLALQTVSLVCWAARLTERVETLEAHDAANLLMIERMARVEERLSDLKETAQRTEAKLDRAR
jgi:hypothetical protein